jgi:CelD/BcsL family acetyltransferase involved in cellulose biosynthesis
VGGLAGSLPDQDFTSSGVPGPLAVDVLDSPRALARLAPDFDRLVIKSPCPVPFATAEWALATWTHLHRQSLGARDHLRLLVVRAPDGEVVGLAPFFLTERPARGPFRLRVLQLLGADPGIADLRAVVTDPVREALVFDALAAHLTRTKREWDVVRWTGLLRTGPGTAALERAAPLRWLTATPDYVLSLGGSWDEMRGRLKRNIRESLRHCYNSLARAGHRFELHVAETPVAVGAALPAFFDLHGRRAVLRNTAVHPDRFSRPSERRFLTDVCVPLAGRGVAKVFELRIQGAVVATRVGFVFGDSLYLYNSGFDPAWASYSVPTTVVAEAIKWAIARGLRRLNLGTGTDVSKTRWGPEETVYWEALQLGPGLRGRVLVPLAQALRGRDRRSPSPSTAPAPPT